MRAGVDAQLALMGLARPQAQPLPQPMAVPMAIPSTNEAEIYLEPQPGTHIARYDSM